VSLPGMITCKACRQLFKAVGAWVIFRGQWLRKDSVAEYIFNREGEMGGINRRDFIKNVAIGSAVLGFGNAVFDKPSKALAGGQHDKEESMQNEKKPEIITSCHCKKVVLKLINLDPRFTVCHCDTCQLVHNGPWYGAYCSDIKIIDGKDSISEIPIEHGQGRWKLQFTEETGPCGISVQIAAPGFITASTTKW
jgi:hypothetical protein